MTSDSLCPRKAGARGSAPPGTAGKVRTGAYFSSVALLSSCRSRLLAASLLPALPAMMSWVGNLLAVVGGSGLIVDLERRTFQREPELTAPELGPF
ncbi:hypothetical protein KOM00_08275 [Geomonas sp. Red69]|uniref:Uncharacterized protein n=1 Tax=Geomonas diazotrophica TaxID=2843197 RepID=A0ABX8JMS7_9BACT|nr:MULTISPECIES: hypothetical protein [Geomonas]MBU5636728.1 hypothetical protein [Geomonas diazotrophica]QWV98461.1 hypothetical protein KP005_03990 [Geomonas nitrogeniifigens]QXE87643.1 hypothetical protein KP003_04350 [Geomonas nitrogeniifigens]